MSLKGGGKSAAEIHDEWLDGMSMRFECAFCTWTFDGGFREGRLAAEGHRIEAHPEIGPYRRRRRGSIMKPRWRSELSDEERAEVDEERRRRAVEIGVDINFRDR